MSTPVDELEARISASLRDWAEQAPTGVDRLEEFETAPAGDARPNLRLLAIAASVTVLAVIAGAIAMTRSSDPTTFAGSDAVRARIAIGVQGGVRVATASDDAIWVTSARDEQLYKVDPDTDEVVATYDVGGEAEGVVVAGGSVWLTSYGPPELLQVDATSGEVTTRIGLPDDPHAPTAAFGALWVSVGEEVWRVDTITGRVDDRYSFPGGAGSITVTDRGLYVASAARRAVVELDPETGAVVRELALPQRPRFVTAVGDDDLWVGLADVNAVVHVDLSSGDASEPITVGRMPMGLALDGTTLWVSNMLDGTVSRIDTATERVISTHPVGDRPSSVVVAFGSIWVTLHRESTLVRIDPTAELEEAATPTFEGMVDIGVRDLYLRCSGSGTATAVIQPDLFDDAAAWPRIEAQLARSTRVCVYDPAGTGASDAGPEPRTAQATASDLRAALETAEIPGPYVLVAHGLGSYAARELAATWPEVDGIVLVDPTDAGFLSDQALDNPAVVGFLATTDEIDARELDLPITVINSDENSTDDPRVSRDLSIRQRFHGGVRDLAERLDATLIEVPGRAWVPTSRPEVVVDAVLEMLSR